MVESTLRCFRYQSQFPLLTEDASTFCSSLTKDIKRLELSLAKHSISLKWLVDVMSLLKRMQVQLLALLKKSKLPISYGADEDWFEQYMQESVSLLDFCNSLKSAVSEIKRYCMIVELAVHKLSEGNSHGMLSVDKFDFEILQKAHEKILDVSIARERLGLGGEVLFGGSGRDEKSVAIVMFAAKTTMIVLSWLLISAVVCPSSINMENIEISPSIPELKQCMEMLTELVRCFYKQISSIGIGRGVSLVEHEMVSEAVGKLKAQVVEKENSQSFLNGLEKLRTRSFELKEGMEGLDTAVNEVFEEVIRGRNEMLDIFRNATL